MKRLALLALIVGSLAAGVPSALSTIQKYQDGNLGYTLEAQSGWNYWSRNEVWRPIGYQYQAWFTNSQQGFLGFVADSQDNPFSAWGPFGYTFGTCSNNSGSTTHATCQVST